MWVPTPLKQGDKEVPLQPWQIYTGENRKLLLKWVGTLMQDHLLGPKKEILHAGHREGVQGRPGGGEGLAQEALQVQGLKFRHNPL